jgi:hypothetical protein
LDYLSLNQIKTTAKQKNGVWFVDNKALLMIQIQKNSPDFEGPFRPSRQLSKSSACEKNQVQ